MGEPALHPHLGFGIVGLAVNGEDVHEKAETAVLLALYDCPSVVNLGENVLESPLFPLSLEKTGITA